MMCVDPEGVTHVLMDRVLQKWLSIDWKTKGGYVNVLTIMTDEQTREGEVKMCVKYK
jgi:hypothetical protein